MVQIVAELPGQFILFLFFHRQLFLSMYKKSGAALRRTGEFAWTINDEVLRSFPDPSTLKFGKKMGKILAKSFLECGFGWPTGLGAVGEQ